MIESIRRISRDLRPGSLDDLGLDPGFARGSATSLCNARKSDLTWMEWGAIGRLPGAVEYRALPHFSGGFAGMRA